MVRIAGIDLPRNKRIGGRTNLHLRYWSQVSNEILSAQVSILISGHRANGGRRSA